MDDAFIRNRISELRLEKGVSEYKMSYDLGHSKGYIQSISSGRALPSMSEFLYICEYFNITPMEFFDVENEHPIIRHETAELLNRLSEEDLALLQPLLERLLGEK